MKIETIFSNPERFNITQLSGGYLGRAKKVSDVEGQVHYILKNMGDTDEQIIYSLFLLQHIKGFGEVLPNMAKVYDWQIQDDGSLLALFEFIENTEDRLPNIAEMIRISNLSFLASKGYDYTRVRKEVDFRRTVLFKIEHNGVERYSKKYFSAHVNLENQAVIHWMMNWADYFIHNDNFKQQYLACVGFVHRDIHRHNIIIHHGQPYLIDFDFSGVDCRLIEITRPTNVYIEVDEFLPMYIQAKKVNDPYFSEIERKIIDRVLVLDIMANLGWEAKEIYHTGEGEYRNELLSFLQNRVAYIHLLMTHRNEFNLDFVS